MDNLWISFVEISQRFPSSLYINKLEFKSYPQGLWISSYLTDNLAYCLKEVVDDK